MPRSYSEPFLIELYKADPNQPGTALALACVRANIPSRYVADALEVTRMTVFSWFRGKPLRHKNQLKVDALTDIIERDLAEGVLPAKNNAQAKTYIEGVIDRKI